MENRVGSQGLRLLVTGRGISHALDRTHVAPVVATAGVEVILNRLQEKAGTTNVNKHSEMMRREIPMMTAKRNNQKGLHPDQIPKRLRGVTIRRGEVEDEGEVLRTQVIVKAGAAVVAMVAVVVRGGVDHDPGLLRMTTIFVCLPLNNGGKIIDYLLSLRYFIIRN